MEAYIRNEYLRPALINGVDYELFWSLTPISLNDILSAKAEREKREYALRDTQNWELGLYLKAAVADVIAGAFGKKSSAYPKKPFYDKVLKGETEQEKLTEEQEQLETMKFKQFFSNMGDYVKIEKKKGGMKSGKQ